MSLLSLPLNLPRQLHPVLHRQIQILLGGTFPSSDVVGLVEALSAHPDTLGLFLAMIDGAYEENDKYLEQTLNALDRSAEETLQLNRQLMDRARNLEAVVVEKERVIGELEKARLQLVNQEKLVSIGTLAAGIAHEINTPTQYVSDNLSFLKDAFADLLAIVDGGANGKPSSGGSEPDLAYLKEEIPAALRQSLEGLERVAKIVRSVKEFSHPGTTGKVAVDLNRAVESTLTVCRNEWKYVAEVSTDLAAGLPLVPCVPGEINQVLLNLVVNAAQAIEDRRRVQGCEGAPGKIHLITSAEGGTVRVDISDNGCGIPEEVGRRIFDPFFTTKEVGRGTGQGLAIARTVIVEKHKGKLSYDSFPGEGTTFHLTLPLAGSQS